MCSCRRFDQRLTSASARVRSRGEREARTTILTATSSKCEPELGTAARTTPPPPLAITLPNTYPPTSTPSASAGGGVIAAGGGEKKEDMKSAAGLCVASGIALGPGAGVGNGTPFDDVDGVTGERGERRAEAAASVSERGACG